MSKTVFKSRLIIICHLHKQLNFGQPHCCSRNVFNTKIYLRTKETSDKVKEIFKLTRKQKIGLAVTSVVGSVCFVCYKVLTLHRRLKLISDAYENERQDNFIYPKEPLKLEYDDIFSKSKQRSVRYKLEKTVHKVLPWFQSKSRDPALLLKLADSSNPDVRHMGLKALTSNNKWGDYQYRMVAQACTNRTMVSLARIQHSDYRLFRPMPWLPPPKASIEDDFRTLLASLPKEGINECIKHFTSKALLEAKPKNIVETGQWCFGGTSLEFVKSVSGTPEGSLEIFCLEALVHHTMMPDQCVKMMELGGLVLLQRIYLQYDSSIVIRRLIAWILANLSLNHNLHTKIIDGGWVAVLHRWLESRDTALYFHTARALANLDRDWDSGVHVPAFYEDGIYLAHPVHRSKEKMHKIHTDIVFIHGLLGGPFKTWRQEDRRHTEADFVVTDEVKNAHTFFWPKDWLAPEVSHVRILNVGYDTEVTMWNAKCPVETEKRSLTQRATALMDKLQRADVGGRPVIWVGHSMGGLLIKEMIRLAETDPRYRDLRNNTTGILFYSTPHYGSSLAKLSNTVAKYMIFPSVEVQELNKDNPNLKTLHKSFLEFISKTNVHCMSFGEMEKSSIGLKMKTHIVPPESADPGVGEFYAMQCNHINICKPKNPDSELYKLSVGFIRRCIFQNRVKEVMHLAKSAES